MRKIRLHKSKAKKYTKVLNDPPEFGPYEFVLYDTDLNEMDRKKVFGTLDPNRKAVMDFNVECGPYPTEVQICYCSIEGRDILLETGDIRVWKGNILNVQAPLFLPELL